MPRKKKTVSTWLPVFLVLFLATLGSVVLVFVFRAELKDSLRFFTQNSPPRSEELKIEHIFRNYPEGSLGIDVSEYQGKINFPELQLQLGNHPIEFVFFRATMGDDGVDKQFRRNWEGFGNMPVLLGAYHYYRPNENSSKQAENFIKTAKLKPGNLIPVLDIEKHSTIQSREKLREGLKNWLRLVEEHYGVKPMIYTGDRFFWDVLHGHGFDGYPIWVANYNLIVEPETEDWEIWQFSEKGRLPGIRERIDLNVFQEGTGYLQSLVIPG